VSEDEIQFSLILNVQEAVDNANKLKTILFRGANVLEKIFGKDVNIQKAINNAQRLLGVLNRVRIVAISIQTALTIGLGGVGGKIAAIFAGVAAGETAVNIAEYTGEDNIYDSTWGV
jgi:hypothetical protein